MIDVDAHVRSLKRELAILIEERDAMLARRPDNATQAQMRIQYVNKRNEQIQATAHAIHVWTRPGPPWKRTRRVVMSLPSPSLDARAC